MNTNETTKDIVIWTHKDTEIQTDYSLFIPKVLIDNEWDEIEQSRDYRKISKYVNDIITQLR